MLLSNCKEIWEEIAMFRIYVEKKENFAVEAKALLSDIRENLMITSLDDIKVLNRYDIEGISEEVYKRARTTILSEPPVDYVYDEEYDFSKCDRVFGVEYLPGQYDQRADSTKQCVKMLAREENLEVKTAKIILLYGKISDSEFFRIKSYYINPIEMREAELKKPESIELQGEAPREVMTLCGFIDESESGLCDIREKLGLAMSMEDICFCQKYFKDEKRNPTITEIRLIDTYWSDHCRHTTFMTAIDSVEIESGLYFDIINTAFLEYKKSREAVYGQKQKDISLMDIATMSMKEQKKDGKLSDLEESDEINACSIIVEADVDGKAEEWLVMFKNETHNHPTEIEPFGGAATCLGGAIRDPLSGRAYVYGAMRVTGSADPRTPIEDTLPGKLPQRKITKGAAAGYSSYGNQIGLATGQVAEIYDEDFVAKRMEIGAVIAGAPRANVVRKKPETGDVIILLGGQTGRDGCGGATGSSKEHDEESLLNCGAEVQKGNAPTERKIQRLFRNPKVTQMIKKCNDFGAGGVAVAVGEIADSLFIDLDVIPKKYEGLDGTELAISESQERMAVLVSNSDAISFIELANEENLDAVEIAKVTDSGRLIMNWRGTAIVDIKREFLDTNGVKQHANVYIKSPKEDLSYFKKQEQKFETVDIKSAWLKNLKDLNVCSQRGLVERFDSTIGSGTVLMPFGGVYQSTPSEGLIMKLPVLDGNTNTGTIMTFGYNPKLSKWSPFHGGMYAVIEAISKIVALGGSYKNIRLTLQEYFEKLGDDKTKWGKPFSALLGAFFVQKSLKIPAIGGKDSMSGTFKDINVPPTLVAFAVNTCDVRDVVSQEFKKAGSKVVLLQSRIKEDGTIDFCELIKNYEAVEKLIKEKQVLSSSVVKYGGIAAAITKMCFGEKIGIKLCDEFSKAEFFSCMYGSIILEVDKDLALDGISHRILGYTIVQSEIIVKDIKISLDEAYNTWEKPLNTVFPTSAKELTGDILKPSFSIRNSIKPKITYAKPTVFIPVFPGTNCEYDTQKAFIRAGAKTCTTVFRNRTSDDIEQSILNMVKMIDQSQIVAIPGGFSAGDEPDGSGKFIATAFRNPKIKDAIMRLLNERDGLMLGICNGFQALIKLGLLPYGSIMDIDENSPTLTYNTIGRHISKMVRTRIASVKSPWLSNVEVGDIHTITVSHGEGRFYANDDVIAKLIENGQVATQYVDFENNPTYDPRYNSNGSVCAIEGITSPDGRILGKMGHSERIGENISKNVSGNKDQKIFESGVQYFK